MEILFMTCVSLNKFLSNRIEKRVLLFLIVIITVFLVPFGNYVAVLYQLDYFRCFLHDIVGFILQKFLF